MRTQELGNLYELPALSQIGFGVDLDEKYLTIYRIVKVENRSSQPPSLP